ncbi:MAG: universal stress protein [Gammaproteobacteria bacterium]|nr:universal stress protein [Gammaproteobacteria bacterium]
MGAGRSRLSVRAGLGQALRRRPLSPRRRESTRAARGHRDRGRSRKRRDGVDLIVVGHRGKGFFERLLVGSVSKQVVTHAYCPVLVVR